MARKGANTIGVTFKADGEKEFKQALNDIDAGLKVNNSELKLLSAEYANNANSSEALTAKSKALQNQIYSQTEKVQTLEKALANSAEKHGLADKKTLEWQASLNRAKADLAKMNNELDDNKKALDNAAKSTSSLGSTIRGLADTVGLDIPPAMQDMVTKLDDVSTSGAALVGVLAGVVVGLAKTTFETAATAKEIDTLSQRMGMTTTSYQEWDYILKQFGGSAEQMQGDLSQLAEKALDAKNGSGEAAEMFALMGIRVTESGGKLKSQEQLFNETVTALQGMTDETKRNAIASALLSTTGENLVPVLNMTKKELADLKNEAHDMGIVMSEESIGKFKQLNEVMKNMQVKGEALKNSLALALLPVLTSLFEVIGSIPVPVLQTIIVLAGVITTVILAVKAIKELTATGSAIAGFFSGMNVATLRTTAIIMGIVAVVITLLVLIAALTNKMNDVKQISGNIANMKSSLTSTSVNTSTLPKYAKGTTNHPGGLALVGEEGPEFVDLPSGSKVYPNGVSPLNSGSGTVNNYYTFKVDDIETYAAIEKRIKNERQSQRMGYVGG